MDIFMFLFSNAHPPTLKSVSSPTLTVDNFHSSESKMLTRAVLPDKVCTNLPGTESSSVMKGLQFLAKTIFEHMPKKGIAM
jgi:hypothetical protein